MKFKRAATITLALAAGAGSLFFANRAFAMMKAAPDTLKTYTAKPSTGNPMNGKTLTLIENDSRSVFGGYRPGSGFEPVPEYERLVSIVVDSLRSKGVCAGENEKFAKEMLHAMHDDQRIRAGNLFGGLFSDAVKGREFDCKNYAIFAGDCAARLGLDVEYVILRAHMVLKAGTVYLDLANQAYYVGDDEFRKAYPGKVFLVIKDSERLKFSSYENLGHLHYARGCIRYMEGDRASGAAEYDTARACIMKALEIAPELPSLWKMLGRICLAQGKPADALCAYDGETVVDSASWDVHYRKGNIYKEMKDYKKALEEYQKARQFGCWFVDADIKDMTEATASCPKKANNGFR